MNEFPVQEVVADIITGESSHEETEDEGHGIRDSLGHFFDSALSCLFLEIKIIWTFGVN